MSVSYPFQIFADEFKGKRALVTGGTKGMGAATVHRFKLSGAMVATTGRSPLPEGLNPDMFVLADISHPAGIQKVVDHIMSNWGGVDILVNNAGGTKTAPVGFRGVPDQEWHEMLELNLMASVRFGRELVSGMVDRGTGAVIHIGSIAGRMPYPKAEIAYPDS